jgi:hypothetical protein
VCAGERQAPPINADLWYACAGPLVSLPPVGSLVVYFPQGHSEQVRTATSFRVHYLLLLATLFGMLCSCGYTCGDASAFSMRFVIISWMDYSLSTVSVFCEIRVIMVEVSFFLVNCWLQFVLVQFDWPIIPSKSSGILPPPLLLHFKGSSISSVRSQNKKSISSVPYNEFLFPLASFQEDSHVSQG